MARILARAAAMQMVYENLEGGEGGPETLQGLIGFVPDVEGEQVYGEDCALIERIVSGVQEHAEELDEKISGFLRNWTIDRIARVDLAILRVAFYELLYDPETAPEVICSEAVDQAKRYSTDRSGAFVNGVLGAFLRDRAGEPA
ncbi:MAG: transcription antitermination factor NusB [Clostridia bacterium]|nr:transcription antitermination factor NusB [Clostridia bacterium]